VNRAAIAVAANVAAIGPASPGRRPGPSGPLSATVGRDHEAR